MSVRFVMALLLASSLSACNVSGGDGPDPQPSNVETEASTPDEDFDSGKALIDTEEGSIFIDVEVAESTEEREIGLMDRESLPSDEGMLFVFFRPTDDGFWMKNTLIPLSIAFIDEDAKIVEILDMEPCREEQCEIYEPGVEYSAALEVNQGAFEEWGVQVGDRITLTR